MSFFPLILVSGCVHATFCLRGRDVLTVLSTFFSPQLESKVTCLATKVIFVIVYFSNHASVLGLQLKKASLHKFLFYYKLPLYMRSWNVNHSLNYFSDVSLSIFTHYELPLRLCYHSNGHSSPATPSLCWLCFVDSLCQVWRLCVYRMIGLSLRAWLQVNHVKNND